MVRTVILLGVSLAFVQMVRSMRAPSWVVAAVVVVLVVPVVTISAVIG